MIEVKAAALPEGIKVDLTMNGDLKSLILESGVALIAIHKKIEEDGSLAHAGVYKKILRNVINNDDFWDNPERLTVYEDGVLS